VNEQNGAKSCFLEVNSTTDRIGVDVEKFNFIVRFVKGNGEFV